MANSDDCIKAEATGGDDTTPEAPIDDDIKAEATVEKPVHRTNMFLGAILIMAAPLSTTFLDPYSAPTMAPSSLPVTPPHWALEHKYVILKDYKGFHT